MKDQAARYVQTTIERFQNPFLNHRLSDIAENHADKVVRRIEAFVAWVREKNPQVRMPRLLEIVEAHR